MATDFDRLRINGRKVSIDLLQAHLSSEEAWSVDEADTFTLDVDDTSRKIIQKGEWKQRSRLDLDGLSYEFVRLDKAGHTLTLTFEDADVAALRRATGKLSASSLTRTQFAERLVKQVPGLTFKGEPGSTRRLQVIKGRLAEDGGVDEDDAWSTVRRLADKRQWRWFVHRHVAWFGSDEWLAKQRDTVKVSESRRGIEGIDVSADTGSPDAYAAVVARAGRWALPPGVPVLLEDLGPADGLWLVQRRSKAPYDDLVSLSLTRRQKALPEPKPEDTGGSTDVVETGSGGYIWPTQGRISSRFGDSRDGGARSHAGLDIAAPIGTPVRASRSGTVRSSGWMSGYGETIILDHPGASTLYAHLSRRDVSAGRSVSQGQVIGAVGNTGDSTGAHLHFEIRPGGRAVDPEKFLP